MEIKEVETKEEAKICNNLLTKLIASEKEFNQNTLSSYVVTDFFEHRYLEKNNRLLIAKVENKIVAYLYIRITSSEDGPFRKLEALIDGLYVEEEYRNRGIATKLIDEATKWARKMNVGYINLKVLSQNEVAKTLYQKLNFSSFEQVLRKEIL